ncbi:VOC family protein [Mesorhizobium sp. IMUNJ 23232]|uniref:VOC family protein n=1 Tax=Mesorhizobium sp. IMUNJ 23232 TaxID=3376064 RepID=UPI00378B4A7F
MFDHLGFRVRDLAAARKFYDAVAASLGLSTIDNTETSFLLSRSAEALVPFVWIGTGKPDFWRDGHRTAQSPLHLAFTANSKHAVDAFHKAALENGGADNGAPGPRGPAEMQYYGAYVIDPDGNNIEAGFRGSEWPPRRMEAG